VFVVCFKLTIGASAMNKLILSFKFPWPYDNAENIYEVPCECPIYVNFVTLVKFETKLI
jgi:hypothetical protein